MNAQITDSNYNKCAANIAAFAETCLAEVNTENPFIAVNACIDQADLNQAHWIQELSGELPADAVSTLGELEAHKWLVFARAQSALTIMAGLGNWCAVYGDESKMPKLLVDEANGFLDKRQIRVLAGVVQGIAGKAAMAAVKVSYSSDECHGAVLMMAMRKDTELTTFSAFAGTYGGAN